MPDRLGTMSSLKPTRKMLDNEVLLLCGVLFVFFLALQARVILFSDIDRLPFTTLVPLTAAASFMLSLHLLGWPRALALLVLGAGIAFVMEWVGERTGLIFGPYCYTDLLGVKLAGSIPLIIPFAWYMMLLPSYVIANLLSDGLATSKRPGSFLSLVWIAALSAGLLTAWDLTMDPIMSFELQVELEAAAAGGVSEAGRIGIPGWRWIVEPAAVGQCAAATRLPDTEMTHFGVPWSNYGGWMFTGFLAFLAFRWLEHRLPGKPQETLRSEWTERLVALAAIGIYFGMALIDTVVGSPKVQDIHLIAPFAMGIPAAAATMLLFRRRG
jgi:uncharacterized membrane protein